MTDKPKELTEAELERIANVDWAIRAARLKVALKFIADTPIQWTKPQADVYWSNLAIALAKVAQDALDNDALLAQRKAKP